MKTQYDFCERLCQLHRTLQDDLSEDIFWAQLRCDVKGDMESSLYLASRGGLALIRQRWRAWYRRSRADGNRLVLYGAGNIGKDTANVIMHSDLDFDGFVDKSGKGQTVLGKPVYAPEDIMSEPDKYYVIIAVGEQYYGEIRQLLLENGVRSSHILQLSGVTEEVRGNSEAVYREFASFVPDGTVLVDAGCYNGEDSIFFSGLFPKNGGIYAFEPDPENYTVCQDRIAEAGISNARV